MNQIEMRINNKLKLEVPESVNKEDQHKDPLRLIKNTFEIHFTYSAKRTENKIKI